MDKNNNNSDDIKKEIIDNSIEKIEKISNEEIKTNEDKNTIDLNIITSPNKNDCTEQKILNLKNAQKINLLLKNKLNIIDLSKKIKEDKNVLISSGWNHSSNYKLTKTLNNENILYKKNFAKCTPVRDSILKEYKKMSNGIVLPEITTPRIIKDINFNSNSETRENNTNSISTTASKYRKKITEGQLNNLLKTCEQKYLSFEKGLYKNANKNDINDKTTSTRPVTNLTNKNKNGENLTEDFGSYQPGILTTGNIGSSNVIIPILKVRRAESNRNCGTSKIFEKLENKTGRYSQSLQNNSKLFDQNNNYCDYNGRNIQQIAKSQEIKNDKNKYNVLNNIDNLIPSFHKIKIEKGIKAANFVNILNKKINDYQKNLQQIKFKFNNNLDQIF